VIEIPTEEAKPTAEGVPDGCVRVGAHLWMTDGKGRLVRRDSIKPAEVLEDEVVRKIMAHAIALSEQVARFKQHTLDDFDGLLGLLAQNYGVVRGGIKGNISLYTFDRLMKCDLAVADRIEFGPELQSAKALVDECLMDWTSEAVAALQTIVQGAFDVDQKGNISPAKLFALLRYDITDERWQRAMKAIRDSIRPMGTKEYVRFYRRPTHRDAFENVTINIAAA
jgi:hypothetical protein